MKLPDGYVLEYKAEGDTRWYQVEEDMYFESGEYQFQCRLRQCEAKAPFTVNFNETVHCTRSVVAGCHGSHVAQIGNVPVSWPTK